MIELYHNDMSVCAQKVRFALTEKKLKWVSGNWGVIVVAGFEIKGATRKSSGLCAF